MPVDLDAARARRDREADAALGARLQRPREDLAGGHVALAVGVDPRAALDRQRQVGALGLDAQLARGGQALDQPRLEVRAARSRRRSRRRGPGTARGARRPRTRSCPCPPAARRPPSATASGTSAARSAASRTGARARAARAIRAASTSRQRARVGRRLDADRGVGRLRLGQLGGAKPSRWASRAAARTPRRRPGSSGRISGHASRSSSSSLEREQQRRGQRASSARRPAGPAGRRGSSRTAAPRSARGRAPSRGLDVREVLGEVLAQDVADPAALVLASRSGSGRAAPSGDVIGSAPAISQRTASRSNRNSTPRCQASSCESGEPAIDVGVLAAASPGSSPRAGRARRPPASGTRTRAP